MRGVIVMHSYNINGNKIEVIVMNDSNERNNTHVPQAHICTHAHIELYNIPNNRTPQNKLHCV